MEGGEEERRFCSELPLEIWLIKTSLKVLLYISWSHFLLVFVIYYFYFTGCWFSVKTQDIKAQWNIC